MTLRIVSSNDSFRVMTSAGSVLPTDKMIIINAGGSFNISLYSAVGNGGRIISFKRVDATATSIVSLVPNGAETIDGVTSIGLGSKGDSITIMSNGTNWLILEEHIEYSASYDTLVGAPVNITYGGTITMGFSNKIKDTHGMFSTPTVTLPRPGVWSFIADAYYAAGPGPLQGIEKYVDVYFGAAINN